RPAGVTASVDVPAGWATVDGCRHRELTFADFDEAFAFMVRVAAEARRLDHHPDWSNSWNTVVIDIVDHAAGRVTEKCAELARAIDAVETG
ncbi:MAG: 4a-hydroxytetrahydrobiopterin dehydratase, partial [Acidimicrobiales bacterium]